MLTVTPNFHFKGQCKQALELYVSALGATMVSVVYYADANSADWAISEGDGGLVSHAEFYIGEQRCFASDASDIDIVGGNAQSLVVMFDDAAKGMAAYDALREDGTVVYPMKQMLHGSCDSCVIDRYGIRWEILIAEGK